MLARSLQNSLCENGLFGSAATIQRCIKNLKPSIKASCYYYFLRQISYIKKRAGIKSSKACRNFPCYLINRNTDRMRLERFDRAAKRIGLDYERVEAVNALEQKFNFHPYKSIIANKYYRKSIFPKGMIGCFLSHFKCWTLLLSSGADLACIFEDDAQVLISPQRVLNASNIPQDADLIFLNNRMSEGFMDSETLVKIKDKGVFFADAFEAVKRTYQKGLAIDGVGTDGYLITKSGADKLLEMFKRHGLYQCVDWEILINSLNKSDFEELVNLHGNKSFSHINYGIRSYVMIPSIVRHSDMVSVLTLQNKNHLVEYEEMFGVKQ